MWRCVLSGLGSVGLSSCVCITFSCCLTLLAYRNVNPCTCLSCQCVSINIGLPHNVQYQASSYLLCTSSLLSVTYVAMTHFKTQLPQSFLTENLDPCFTSSKTRWQAGYIKLPHNCIKAAQIPFLNGFFFLRSLKSGQSSSVKVFILW